ncbi:class I SAM-dependent methyltransferase [Amycolatopsis rhabdoformis]|uniref:Class I SAM-dependent methyltransferase n=1 Tax=Amycolatopsis rhabdoformis TaxID=1448059 RepID=A0ABZ1I4C5_9PSEU|nr:class I SAM-dependent methyltransferase [Amycolatopsis rhabdoformis]WSE29257.1 class I SAM-dependent methyltransferase [Amycolatopsis rhabdoformis]
MSSAFDEMAAGYDDDPFHPLVADKLISFVPERPALLVDAATGTGAAAFAALRLSPGAVLGVDISASMVDLARTKATSLDPAGVISWQVGPAVPLPVPDAGADAVVCASALHFLGATALADWARVLRPGGVLAFSISSSARFKPGGSMGELMPRDLRIPGSEAEAAGLATAAGFSAASAETVAAHMGGRERLVFAVRAVR